MFLNYRTSDGHRMATAYCGLQKSLRVGNEDFALYWAGQIGKSTKRAKGYPNALKKRLCQNALEDAASWTYASRLLVEVPNGPKLEFEELIPWVQGLVHLSKTHSTAWLNRVAAQHVYDGLTPFDQDININKMNEIEFAAACLQAHSVGDTDALKRACLDDGDLAMKLYKFVNSDPLVLHAWQMHQRRPELRNRDIMLNFPYRDLSGILATHQELPLEWFDKHTKEGKKMGRGYSHFFEIMELHPRVYDRGVNEDGDIIANACVRGGNDPYEEEAKNLYLDFKLNGQEARVRHLLDSAVYQTESKKRMATDEERKAVTKECDDEMEEEGIVVSATKKMKQEVKVQSAEVEEKCSSSSSVSGQQHTHSGALRDIDVFHIPEETGLIGFKNFTVIGVLKMPLQGVELTVGDRVFVKMGESYENCMFALACDAMKGQLGMVSMQGKMAVDWVIPTYDAAALVSRTNPNWAAAVTKRMNKAKDTLSNGDGALPCIVMGMFEGEDLCQRKEWMVDGMHLLKILLFRKFVGAADTNGKNMMINESGIIFSVDETIASAEQLIKYSSKGLITAQSIHSNLLDKAVEALYDRPVEVGNFINLLKQLNLPAVVCDGDRLSAIHSKVPFDVDTVAFLQNATQGDVNSKRDLQKLAKILKLK